MTTARNARAERAGLHLADDLELPIESIVETFAILGKRGSGKTSTAVVMAEEMIGAGHPVVVVDPVGVWWGLRSSKTGKGQGLPVVIFGGDHADVPLTDTAGQVIADAVISGRFPAILDLSHLSKSAMRRFMADFLERLYHRNREPLHVIVDEADLMAPQRLPAEGLRLFGAMDDIQRRGRARGIGTTLITQRPAVLNKDLLSQAEVLIAMRLTGARDVAAIDEWVRLNADEDEAKAVKASLASLAVGTAWVWSPSLLGILQKVPVRQRRTFDSSATPKPGTPRPVASAFARIDTEALGAQITALAEEAAASDPAALRRLVAELRRELELAEKFKHKLAPAPVAAPVEQVTVEVKVPALTVDQEKLLDEVTERVREYAVNAADRAELAAVEIKEQVAVIGSMLDELRQVAQTRPPAAASVRTSKPIPVPVERAPRRAEARPQAGAPASDSDVPPARRRLLDALVALESIGVVAAPRGQVALFAGVSPKSSGFANNLGALNSAGLIAYPVRGQVKITNLGRSHACEVPEVATTGELHARVREVVSPSRWRLLEPLLAAYPEPISKDELAEAADVSAKSSGFANNLGALRSLGLLDYPAPGYVVASQLLFLG